MNKVFIPTITKLKRIPVKGGDVLHAIKKSEKCFGGFGEAYYSFINEGSVKAWKKHHKMTLNLVVPVGCVKFVFLIDSKKGVFKSEEIGENRYLRITVPPGIWFGFKGVGPGRSLVTNFANIEHEPNEVEKCENLNFKYNW